MRRTRWLVVATLVALALGLYAPPSDAYAQRRRGSRRGAGGAGKAAAPAFPPFEQRHAEWVRRRELALNTGAPDPDPLGQYLVSEVVVTGTFETDTGPGVFLYATPTQNTFFATAGVELYNGRLTQIRPAASGFADQVEVVFLERGATGGTQPVVKRVEGGPLPAPPDPAAPPSTPQSAPADGAAPAKPEGGAP
jgi:hypothetical protein